MPKFPQLTVLAGLRWLSRSQKWSVSFFAVCTVVWSSAFGWCLNSESQSIEVPAETRYHNPNYLYSILLPAGLECERPTPPAPNHGCRIALSQTAYILVDGSYNSIDSVSPADAFLRWHVDALFSDGSLISVLRRFPTTLGGVAAERVVFTHSQGNEERVLEDVVIAIRTAAAHGEIVYTVKLVSAPERYEKDKQILETILSSWRNEQAQ